MIHLSGHTKDVRAVAFAPDGKLASGGSDGTVRIWNARGENVLTIRADRPVYALAIDPNLNILAYAGRHAQSTDQENRVRLWNLSTNQAGREYLWPMEPNASQVSTVCSIWSLSFSADGLYLIAAARRPAAGKIPNGAGERWWLRGHPMGAGALYPAKICSVSFAPQKAGLGVTSLRQVAFFIHPNQDRNPVTYKLQCDWAPAIAYLADGNTAVVGAGGYLHMLDPAGKTRRRKVKTGFRAITSLAASPVAVGGTPDGVEIYDVENGTRRAAFDFDIGKVHGLAFGPDGLTYAVAGDRGLILCDADFG